ncbi:LysR family transcriptional regulator [Bacteriovoracaceae bacterium]|nr:LysR family transcriptional regulator [Bacteriovoracaceae bacterium]|tara:strand:+ start:7964 stop:8884 length:921 start_codon:yes stop_codon:yes gene_type:complete
MISNINLNLIRVFESVYRHMSMTAASKELNMTQSGVSQNIKLLEDLIGFTLFDRVKQKLMMTPKAQQLYEKSLPLLQGLDATLSELSSQEFLIQGHITIGLPIEYGNNMILPILSEWASENKLVTMKILYGHASEMNNLLLQGRIDFAIVDSFEFSNTIKTEDLSFERLFLCGSDSYLKKLKIKSNYKQDYKFFSTLDYIAYLEGEPVIRQWFKFHFKKANINIRIKTHLMDVHGMGTLISNGLGVGILPLHVIKKLNKQGHKIKCFKESAPDLINKISLAYNCERTLPPAVGEAMSFLQSKFKQD